MRRRTLALTTTVLLTGTMLAAAWPALAADVTPDRLVNADREPQNWLMNHRTYNGQRFSPLARINKGNVKNLKLAYAIPLGGGSAICGCRRGNWPSSASACRSRHYSCCIQWARKSLTGS